jgi:hypothetical protein
MVMGVYQRAGKPSVVDELSMSRERSFGDWVTKQTVARIRIIK